MDTVQEAIPPPTRHLGTPNPTPKMVSTARPAPRPATTLVPRMASTTTPSPQPTPTQSTPSNKDSKHGNNNNNNNNTPSSYYYASLVRYWGPQWKSPEPEKSQQLLTAAVLVFTSLVMLYYVSQRYFLCERCPPSSEGHYVFLFLLKLFCAGYQIYLGGEHAELRLGAYDTPFRAHQPVHAGLTFVCLVLLARTVGLGYELDLGILLYALEFWYWAAYWVEW
ncbi:hypothetical protein PG996_009257 [Apiospora saccharicola]|uniref:Uncharacterized protein n=1 Tax=Apiospora saccharicola TaxID=335842 RepID=A0ABR1UK90_9PEZI